MSKNSPPPFRGAATIFIVRLCPSPRSSCFLGGWISDPGSAKGPAKSPSSPSPPPLAGAARGPGSWTEEPPRHQLPPLRSAQDGLDSVFLGFISRRNEGADAPGPQPVVLDGPKGWRGGNSLRRRGVWWGQPAPGEGELGRCLTGLAPPKGSRNPRGRRAPRRPAEKRVS